MGNTIKQLFKHYFLAASLSINAMHIKDSDCVHFTFILRCELKVMYENILLQTQKAYAVTGGRQKSINAEM